MSTFGERLTRAMAVKGLNGKQLAAASGVDAGNISRLREKPSAKRTGQDTILALAKALDVDPVWLATGEGEMRAPAQPKVSSAGGSPALEEVLRRFEWPEEADTATVDRVVAQVRGEAFSDGRDRPESVWAHRIRELLRDALGKSKRIANVVHDDPVEERKRARKRG